MGETSWDYNCGCCNRTVNMSEGSTDFFVLCAWCYSPAHRLWVLLGLPDQAERSYDDLREAWDEVRAPGSGPLPWVLSVNVRVAA